MSEFTPTKEKIADHKDKAVGHETKPVAYEYIPRSLNATLQPFLAGAIAGIVGKTAIAPFDRSKIHFQVSSKPFSVRALFKFIIETWQTSGFFSLYRGNTATMARVIPYAAVQFASHEHIKHAFAVRWGYPLPLIERFAAGALAGMTSVTLTYPLDMLRARMAVSSRQRYPNLGATILRIYREEGARAFYRGFLPTVIGIIPYAGTAFFTYETLKAHHAKNHGAEDISPIDRLLYGAIAGVCGQTSSYPLDVVRRRMQTAKVVVAPDDALTAKTYRRLTSTLMHVLRTEGLRLGLYKGLSLNFIKGPVANGLAFTTFDLVSRLLDDLSGRFTHFRH